MDEGTFRKYVTVCLACFDFESWRIVQKKQFLVTGVPKIRNMSDAPVSFPVSWMRAVLEDFFPLMRI